MNSILELHNEISKRWVDIHSFINIENLSLVELCKSNNALFAKGPVNLLKEYEQILTQYDMKPYLFNARVPMTWVKNLWVNETRNMKVLIIGQSYVIAEKFDFEQV